MADEWQPVNDVERALLDAMQRGEQDRYFEVLGGADLILPFAADATGAAQPGTWATWGYEGRTYILAFTSQQALASIMGRPTDQFRTGRLAEICAWWPDESFWLAVDFGLPVAGYLPAAFVGQLTGVQLGSQLAGNAAGQPAVPADRQPTEGDHRPWQPASDQQSADAQAGESPAGQQAGQRAAEQHSWQPAADQQPAAGPQPAAPAGQASVPDQPAGPASVAEQGGAQAAEFAPAPPDGYPAEQAAAAWQPAGAQQYQPEPAAGRGGAPYQQYPPSDAAQQYQQAATGQTGYPGHEDGAGAPPASGEFAPPSDAAGFQPANPLEQTLLSAAQASDRKTFMDALLGAYLLVPVPQGATPGPTAITGPDFPWPSIERQGTTQVPVFTSQERMQERVGAAPYAVVPFVLIIEYWPHREWYLALDADTPVSATFDGDQIAELAEWASRTHLAERLGVLPAGAAPPRQPAAPAAEATPAESAPADPTAPADGAGAGTELVEGLLGPVPDRCPVPLDGLAVTKVPAGSDVWSGQPDTNRLAPLPSRNPAESLLLDAVAEGDPDAYLRTLLATAAVVPVPPGADAATDPTEPGFAWANVTYDGHEYVVAFTSATLAEATVSGDIATVVAPFPTVLAALAVQDRAVLVDPGTEAEATLTGDLLRRLADSGALGAVPVGGGSVGEHGGTAEPETSGSDTATPGLDDGPTGADAGPSGPGAGATGVDAEPSDAEATGPGAGYEAETAAASAAGPASAAGAASAAGPASEAGTEPEAGGAAGDGATGSGQASTDGVAAAPGDTAAGTGRAHDGDTMTGPDAASGEAATTDRDPAVPDQQEDGPGQPAGGSGQQGDAADGHGGGADEPDAGSAGQPDAPADGEPAPEWPPLPPTDAEPEPEAEPVPSLTFPVLLQKALPDTQVPFYLERHFDRVGGWVHRAEDAPVRAGDLRVATGLADEATAEPVHTIRWHIESEQLLPVLAAARSASDPELAEYRVGTARLPHGAELYRIDPNGEATVLAVFNADHHRWHPLI